MTERLSKFLLDNWNTISPHLPRPEKLRFLLTKGSLGGYGGRVTFLVFSDNNRNPQIVVKVARDPKDIHLLKAEYDSLKYAGQALSVSSKSSLPQVFFLGALASYDILVEECILGKSADALITDCFLNRRTKAVAILDKVCRWHIEFQKEIAVKRNVFCGVHNQQEYVIGPLESFIKLYGLSSNEKDFIGVLKNAILNMGKEKIPFVFEHGDFSPINIIFSSNKFAVIDWGSSKPQGLPFHDLFFLLVWLSGPHAIENLRSAFLSGGKISRISFSLISEYCRELNINTNFVKAFFVLFLANLANKEYSILSRQAERGYIVPLEPFGRGIKYADGTLFKNGIYINLFRYFFEHEKEFIF